MMTDIDSKIRNSLDAEDQLLLKEIEKDASLFEMLGMAFHGKQAWMTWYMWVMGFIAFIAGVYCAREFFATDELKTAMAWMLGVMVSLTVMIIIKTVGWMQMQKLELLREIKRLEVRLLLDKS